MSKASILSLLPLDMATFSTNQWGVYSRRKGQDVEAGVPQALPGALGGR